MRVSPTQSQRRGWIDWGGRKSFTSSFYRERERESEQGRGHWRLRNKSTVGSSYEDPPKMAVKNPYCLHDQKLKYFSKSSTVTLHLKTTHHWEEPIKVIQNCDQSITDKCRWGRKRKRRRQNLWDISASKLWDMQTTAAIKKLIQFDHNRK